MLTLFRALIRLSRANPGNNFHLKGNRVTHELKPAPRWDLGPISKLAQGLDNQAAISSTSEKLQNSQGGGHLK